MKITTPGQPWYLNATVQCPICTSTMIIESKEDVRGVYPEYASIRCPQCEHVFDHLREEPEPDEKPDFHRDSNTAMSFAFALIALICIIAAGIAYILKTS